MRQGGGPGEVSSRPRSVTEDRRPALCSAAPELQEPLRPHERRVGAAAAGVIAVLAVALALVTVALVAVSRGSTTRGQPDTVSWRSGVYPGNGFDTKAAQQFATYRGRPLDIVTVFLDSRNWNDVRYSNWAFKRYAGFHARMAVALPLTVRGTPLSAVADGSHDAAFVRFAHVLLAEGRGNSDIRLGWEFNGSTFPWAANRGSGYLAAFRRVSRLLKRLLPNATIDWNGDSAKGKSGSDPFTDLYPGDAYVDVIGMDAYDHGKVRANTPAAFRAWTDVPFGLEDWATFAADHHKKFAVPEWGVTANGGADDQEFITGMFQWFTKHADQLAYEAYFNEPDGGGRAHNSLTDPVEMPFSSALYRKMWAEP